MTYRDDHDAAIARADALAEEVEELKREREKLATALEDAKEHEAAAVAAATTPPPRDPAPRNDLRSRATGYLGDDAPVGTSDAEREFMARKARESAADRKAKYIISGVLLAAIGVAAAIGIAGDRSKARARDEKAARKAVADRDARHLYIAANFAECISDAAWGDAFEQYYAEKHCTKNCEAAYATHRFTCDAGLPELGYPSRSSDAPLAKLAAANAAIDASHDRAHRDAAVAQRRAAYAEVRRIVLPQLRKTIDGKLEQATARDDRYYRAKLILAFRDLVDAALVASKIETGTTPDYAAAAIAAQPLLAAIEAEAKTGAPRTQKLLQNWSYFTDEVHAGVLTIGTIELFMNNELRTIQTEKLH